MSDFIVSGFFFMQINKYLLNSERQFYYIRKQTFGNSLAVQWLGLRASTAGGMGSFHGRGAKIPHSCTAWPKVNK